MGQYKGNFAVVTSWDDGHVEDLKLADRLERYGVKGTFFVRPANNTQHREQWRRLDDDSLQYLSEIGEVGSHTVTHPDLVSIDNEKASDEIRRSKLELEAIVRKPVVGFCYPFGRWNERIKSLVVQAGYEYARVIDDFSYSILCRGPFEVKTTVDAHRRFIFSKKTAKRLWNDIRVIKYMRDFKKWDRLAIRVFDYCQKHADAFHLWGHSWMIERSGDWDKLDRVLEYVSNKDRIEYMTLQQYVEMARKRTLSV